MYDLNLSIASAAPQTLGVDSICTTPRTPEILNSLIAMTNPLDSYPYPQAQLQAPPVDSCSDSPVESPAGHTATPSVQKTCSLLIKAGLKLTIQSKRKMSGGDSSGTENGRSRKDTANSMDDTDDDDDTKSPRNGLTPEDEERRRRRRERNKIAATKCRMKKRERTLNLVSESEILELQNIELKNQERALETERRKLMEALQLHSTNCIRPGGYQPPPPPPTTTPLHYNNNNQQNSTMPNTGTTTGRGRRGAAKGDKVQNGRVGRGAKNGLCCRKVKQEPMDQLVQTTTLNNNPVNSQPLPQFHNDTFYHKFCHKDEESPTLDFYPYSTALSSSDSSDASFILKSPSSTTTNGTNTDLTNGSNNNFHFEMTPPPPQINHPSNNINNPNHNNNNILLKNDDIYIPNCENDSNDLLCTNTDNHLMSTQVGTVTSNDNHHKLNDNNNNNIDPYLKSELIDNSPYTTINSGDRFLFDDTVNPVGCNDDVDSKYSLGGNTNSELALYMNSNGHHMNNSVGHQNGLNHNHNNLTTTTTTTTLLLKSDFLSQNSEFMSLTGDCGVHVGDGIISNVQSHYTDLDSGITTYSNIHLMS